MSTTVTKNLTKNSLQLVVNDGVNASGNTKTLTKSYNNINADATAEEMYNAAVALGSLYANELANVYNTEKFLLQSVETEG